MAKYIKRGEAICLLKKYMTKDTESIKDGIVKEVYLMARDHAISYLSIMEIADVVERKHGRWRKRGNEKTCSECKFIYYSNNDEWNFCPNCCADMRGRKE